MNNETHLSRVLARKDVLALAFGAMIGWGWIVLTAVLARELASRVRGLNYPFLVACAYLSSQAWVTGLSSSIPMNRSPFSSGV